MSFNQSKSDKSEAVYRISGRSARFKQQRGSSGAYVKGCGGGPAPSVTSASSLSSSRSFNESNNAQGGQSRVNPTPVNSTESNSASAARAIQNGTHVQPQLHGASDAPVKTKSSESSAAQRSTRVVPKAPTSQPPPLSSDPAAPTTPAKGDASKAFPFQFGSINPGFMNGMAIPAHTSSAPPNLDEQKHDQPDKSEAVYRKSGRSACFNQQRGSSGAYVKGGGGGPAPSVTSASSLSSSQSFNKSNNAQGGQSRVNPTPVNSTESNSASAARAIQNGTHVQQQLHGASDAPVTTKSSESSAAQRSVRVVPKAPTSQPPPLSSVPAAPTTPAKGDASEALPFQFGSINPGFMNGMAIPARTSSAPPNLDEQKHDQARHDSFRSVPSVPTPPVLKQQQPPRKDVGVTDQCNGRLM